jgi:hypothetical protein
VIALWITVGILLYGSVFVLGLLIGWTAAWKDVGRTIKPGSDMLRKWTATK